MPKPTFLNLPAEKRDRITEIAIEEFSSQPFQQASLSRVVARAGIAKGSIYHYFENKLDLYRWLVTDELERRRSEWVAASAAKVDHPANGVGLFAELERTALIQIGFMLAHPRLARLAANAMEPTLDAELRELHAMVARQQLDGLVAQLRTAQLSGEIRANLDARSLAHYVDAMLLRGTANVVLDRLGLDTHGLLLGDASASLAGPEWRTLIEQALDLIRHGIGHPAHKARPGASTDPRVHAHTHVN